MFTSLYQSLLCLKVVNKLVESLESLTRLLQKLMKFCKFVVGSILDPTSILIYILYIIESHLVCFNMF